MRDLNDLYLFVQVTDHGGFAPAGRALHMPKSKLSRRIAALEEELGVRLIQRSTRRFSVTEIGQEYYRHCVAMLVEAEAAQEAIDRTQSEPQGVLRISCPTGLLGYQVGDLLARYLQMRPRVQIHLESTNRLVDVIKEGFDIALRVRFPPLEDSDLVMRVLGESTQRLVASPSLLEANLPGRKRITIDDLASLPSLGDGPTNRDHVLDLIGPSGRERKVHHTPRMVSDDRAAMRFSALQGVGYVQLPLAMVRDDLAAGTLIDFLPAWRPRAAIIHAVFPSRRGLLPAVRDLLEFLFAEFEKSASARNSIKPPRAQTRTRKKKI